VAQSCDPANITQKPSKYRARLQEKALRSMTSESMPENGASQATTSKSRSAATVRTAPMAAMVRPVGVFS
jgi:hypothetical protein